MTEEEARRIAEDAAERALVRMLLRLGIDSEETVEVQRDMAFVRDWRQSTEAIKRQGLLAAIGIIVVGILGLVWAALKGGP